VPYVKKIKCTKVKIVVICRSGNHANYRVIESQLKSLDELNNVLQANYKGDEKNQIFCKGSDSLGNLRESK
jgi:uncharacterized protein related to proFAR isomerase